MSMSVEHLCDVKFDRPPAEGDMLVHNGYNFALAEGGTGLSLSGMGDVSNTPPTVTGQALVYDAAAGQYVPSDVLIICGEGDNHPVELDIAGIATGQVPVWDGTRFVPGDAAAGGGDTAFEPYLDPDGNPWPGASNYAMINPKNSASGFEAEVTFGQCALTDTTYRDYQTGLAIEVLSHDTSTPTPASSGLEVFRRNSVGGADRVSIIAQYAENDNSGIYSYMMDVAGAAEISCIEFATTPETNWLAPDPRTTGYLGYHRNFGDGGNDGWYGIYLPSSKAYFGGDIAVGAGAVPWADYVFEPGYRDSEEWVELDALKAFVTEEFHFPWLKTAAEIAEEGLTSFGQTCEKFLKTMEIMGLHLFDIDDRLKALETK